MRRLAALAMAGMLALAPAAQARAPVVEQLVVFRSGKAVAKRVPAAGLLMSVGRRRCAAGTGTALAALARSRVARLRLRDFGACSRKARDGGGLFVSAIGSESNRGRNGWIHAAARSRVGRRGSEQAQNINL